MIAESRRAILLIVLSVGYAQGDGHYNLVDRQDPCSVLCFLRAPLPYMHTEYGQSCCQRGCRFYNLVDLSYGFEPDSINGTRDACLASCEEGYRFAEGRTPCSLGCDLMSKRGVPDILPLFSMTIYDVPEIDILSDPGLRKELLPLWWDSNGFKLPQTFVRTVPRGPGSVDYTGLPSDYPGENDSGVSWLFCPTKHAGIPFCLLTSVIVATALYAFWLCLCAEKTNNHYKEIFVEVPEVTTKVQLYIPDEAPLHRQPPPKYAESLDPSDDDAKI